MQGLSNPMLIKFSGEYPVAPYGYEPAISTPASLINSISWGGYITLPFRNKNNETELLMMTYDKAFTAVAFFRAYGLKSIVALDVDQGNQVATLYDEDDNQYDVSYNTLIVPPSVKYVVASTLGLQPPSGFDYWPNDNSTIPVLYWGDYMYVPMISGSGIENIFWWQENHTSVLICYDNMGNFFKAIITDATFITTVNVANAQQVINIEGPQVTPLTKTTAVLNYDQIAVGYTRCYVPTIEDILYVASTYNLTISARDAYTLLGNLPMFCCANCGSHNMDSGARTANTLDVGGVREAYVGAIIGGILGAAAGFLVGGPAGGLLGASLGSQMGMGIGLTVEVSPSTDSQTFTEVETKTFVPYDAFPVGPFANSSVFENMIDSHFPRYGTIEFAGSIAPPATGSDQLQIFYPTSNKITSPNLTKYPPFKPANGDEPVYKFIFVIVKIDLDGSSSYQMRIHPEDFFPDTINSINRINHSQLSEGYRILSLMGFSSMEGLWGGLSVFSRWALDQSGLPHWTLLFLFQW